MSPPKGGTKGRRGMKTISVLFVLMVLWLLSMSTPAHTATKVVKWVSYGVKPCSQVLSTHARMTVKENRVKGPPEVWALIGWVSGFASAANSAIGSPPNYFRTMTDVDMVNWVASWCRKNPSYDLDKAMRVLAIKYRPF